MLSMYMYQELRKVIMNTKGKSTPKDWSPNSIKSIIITREFIFVAYHLTQPRYAMLNPEEAIEDIQRNGSNGALHNLLSQKQLSCLEEIYVDSVFENYKGILDLEGYVNGLVSSVSRLRFYGYIANANIQEIMNTYSNAITSRTLGYSYALDIGRTASLMYQSTDNNNWFSKYNLRPDKYSTDAYKGSLNAWFKKVENKLLEEKQAELDRVVGKGINSAVATLYKQDLNNADNIKNFLLLKKRIAHLNSDVISSDVKKAIMSVELNKSIQKISVKQLQEILSEEGINTSSGKESFILKSYKLFSVLGKEEVELNLEKLVELAKSYEGLLGLPTYFCNICSKLAQKSNNVLDDTLIMLRLVMSNMGLLKSETDLLKVIHSLKSNCDCVSIYMDILLGLCGCTTKTIGGRC